jgi:ORF6N domain.
MISFRDVEKYLIRYRDQDVLLDYAVAKLYGVETKRINEAVKNNPDKFPNGYVLEISKEEYNGFAVEIFDRKNDSKSRFAPKAFTEKGLYMLATILKSPMATHTTLAIIEAFSKIRELSRAIGQLSSSPDLSGQKSLIRKSGEILTDLFGQDLHTTDTETEIELNFAVLKLKHTFKRRKDKPEK